MRAPNCFIKLTGKTIRMCLWLLDTKLSAARCESLWDVLDRKYLRKHGSDEISILMFPVYKQVVAKVTRKNVTLSYYDFPIVPFSICSGYSNRIISK